MFLSLRAFGVLEEDLLKKMEKILERNLVTIGKKNGRM